MDNTQGTTVVDPAPVEGQQPTTPAVSVDLSKLAPDNVPAVTPAAPQGDIQGQDPVQATVPDEVKHWSSIANQRQAEIYRLQQEKEALLRQQAMQQPQQSNINPYNPETQPNEWWDWKLERNAIKAADLAEQRIQRQLEGALRQNQEMAWIQAHPGVDVNLIKAFNQANGIADWNLDAGWKLLNLPQTVNTVAQRVQQQTIQDFKQPQNFAQPVRAQNVSSQPTVFDFNKLLAAAAENPGIIDQLPEADRKEFLAAIARMQ